MRKSKNNWLWDLKPIQLYRLILLGKVNHFPSGYWNDCLAEKRAIECVHYLFQDVLKLPEDKIFNINYTYFMRKYKLSGMLKIVFNNNSTIALEKAFPHLKSNINKDYSNE